ncbi:MAG: adenosylcobinamide-GDP ribazoletransferase [Pseudomonadota bacterium]
MSAPQPASTRPGALRREAARLGAAVEFLTRLPVPSTGWEDGRLRFALAWFPLVGLGLGAVQGGVLYLGLFIFPAPVAAGLAMAVVLWLSGALHEDGLADTADGLGGSGVPKERSLAIMHDSRIGTYGAVALMIAIGLRWAALSVLAAVPGLAVAACAVSGVLSRSAILPLVRLPFAREGGLAAMVAPPAGAALAGREGSALVAAAMIVVAVVGAVPGLLAIVAAVLAAILAARLAMRRLGGVTGDIFGAAVVAVEVSVLVALTGVLL